ncbi:MAG: S-layer homology domain-containing protein [Oscillospiraceae bacterium]|nr:S-layer homology domain-containing protein [Oscillospiraceae bacterium]
MVTQILYNLDSGKADGALPTFTDVSANDWYADSVTWAVSNGVARG